MSDDESEPKNVAAKLLVGAASVAAARVAAPSLPTGRPSRELTHDERRAAAFARDEAERRRSEAMYIEAFGAPPSDAPEESPARNDPALPDGNDYFPIKWEPIGDAEAESSSSPFLFRHVSGELAGSSGTYGPKLKPILAFPCGGGEVRIYLDGGVDFSEGVTLDEAAAAFWRMVFKIGQEIKTKGAEVLNPRGVNKG